MRANIPRKPDRPNSHELSGPYLRAMQEISIRLMDVMPATDELWQILGQTESLLLEAQLREMPLQEVLGKGGTAAFCQSILDEYMERNEVTAPPAAFDPAVKAAKPRTEPRGGINLHRKKIFTAVCVTVLCLVISSFLCWYLGFWNYWTGGSSYYLKELYNFTETTRSVTAAPVRLTFPLRRTGTVDQILYTDPDLHTVSLTHIGYETHTVKQLDTENHKVVEKKYQNWYVELVYTVHADFKTVSYVEPGGSATAKVVMPDGTEHICSLEWIQSGAYGEGYEYARLKIIELPAEVSVEGATVELDLGVLRLVEWNRIGTGMR